LVKVRGALAQQIVMPGTSLSRTYSRSCVLSLGASPAFRTEFVTFVMARHNYPFELATDDDQKLIAAGATTAA
jgi:hypothetical protein